MTRIGFIGLGHMGRPMAKNLLQSGFEVHIYDVVTEAYSSLVEAGAIVEPSIAVLTEQVEVVITSVQTSQQVHSICLNPEGIFPHAKPHLMYIDCSSIDITTTQALHQAAKERKLSMLDAPVSGGVAGAASGTLTFMVGGEESDFLTAQPILKAMGKKMVYAGSGGGGQAAKICNNLLLAISMIGVCEAFSLAKKLGLDQKKFFEISSNASGQCWSMTSYCPVPGMVDNVPANRDYQPGFMAKMMLKDLRLGQHAAESVDASIPLGSLATELYELFVNQGFGEKDFSSIIHFIAASKK